VDEILAARRARLRVRVGAAVVLVLVGLGCAVLVSVFGGHAAAVDVARPTAAASAESMTRATILVHILGAVQHPGLYELSEGDRAIDAVSAAGGFTDAADRAQLNLARFVVDAEQIYVPSVGEVPAGETANTSGKVNINTADEAELDTLPRVGPATAARIIAWREANGRFTAIEDLMNVTGIGDKTFEGMKDLVTV
jgi:competence protein ComEA